MLLRLPAYRAGSLPCVLQWELSSILMSDATDPDDVFAPADSSLKCTEVHDPPGSRKQQDRLRPDATARYLPPTICRYLSQSMGMQMRVRRPIARGGGTGEDLFLVHIALGSAPCPIEV